MIRTLFVFLFIVVGNISYSQLYVGTEGMTVKSGETLSFDGLTFTPTGDFTLTSTTLSRTDDITITPTPTGTYIKRYYSFSSEPTFAGNIRFSYLNADLNGLSAGNLKLNIRTNGTSWTAVNGTDVNTAGGSYVEATSIASTNLNMLTLASASAALPVTWLSFTAEKQGAGALLKWSTATEQNTKDFEVQHSTNAVSWTALGTVDAAGNSNTVRSYTFTHATPFKGNIYNYYRILQRDVDGKSSYSKIASLIYDEPGADVIVYPNPAKESLTIYLAETQEVRLVNVAGATIWKGTLTAGRNQLNLTRFAKGIYWVITESVKKQIVIQ
jgi:Secretion system C-terminal sorting domain